MQRFPTLIALFLASIIPAHAQWSLQTSHTTADLHAVHSIGNGAAWASGANGTVLRTTDDGSTWQRCSTPPGAAQLDFRGIQVYDADTAIVLSSGRGDQSRLYKTADGCRTWKLILTNPDIEGFWDVIVINRLGKQGELLGGPVRGKFAFWQSSDKGNTWQRINNSGLDAFQGEGSFAISNSALFLNEDFATGFVTGGSPGARVLTNQGLSEPFSSHALPLARGSVSTGAVSIESREKCCWVVVGGDYKKPNDSSGTAAYTHDGGKTWLPAKTPPQGFRTSVAYDKRSKSWVTVGPNGTDVSIDDGETWSPLRPRPKMQEGVNADKNWNAISLPFVVGNKGRIGRHYHSNEDHQ